MDAHPIHQGTELLDLLQQHLVALPVDDDQEHDDEHAQERQPGRPLGVLQNDLSFVHCVPPSRRDREADRAAGTFRR